MSKFMVVTGVGPRCGTSYVMNEARKAGLPIHGERFLSGSYVSVPEHNIEGYWETDPNKLKSFLNNPSGIIKLWNPILKEIDQSLISGLVLLERKDKQAQLQSMKKVFRAEMKIPINKLLAEVLNISPESIFLSYMHSIDSWVKARDPKTVLQVYTEDLTERTQEIITFFKTHL